MKLWTYVALTAAVSSVVGTVFSVPWWLMPVVGIIVGSAVLSVACLMERDYDEGGALLLLSLVLAGLFLATTIIF